MIRVGSIVVVIVDDSALRSNGCTREIVTGGVYKIKRIERDTYYLQREDGTNMTSASVKHHFVKLKEEEEEKKVYAKAREGSIKKGKIKVVLGKSSPDPVYFLKNMKLKSGFKKVKRDIDTVKKSIGDSDELTRILTKEKAKLDKFIRVNRAKINKKSPNKVYSMRVGNLLRTFKTSNNPKPKRIKDILNSDLVDWLRLERYRLKKERMVAKKFEGVSYQLLNGQVHVKSGTMLKLQEKTLKTRVFADKKPKTDDNYVGVELEFTAPCTMERVAELIIKNKLSKFVTLKADGSIRTNSSDTGHEICILAKEVEIRDVVTRVCSMLNDEVESGVNGTCGLHIHLDMRNRDAEKCGRRLYNAQDILFSLVPKNRAQDDYCKKLGSFNFNLSPNGERYDTGRYFGINMMAYKKFTTIEIRMHSGTTNERKINNWIELLLGMINSEKLGSAKVTKLSDFTKDTPIRPELSKYLEQRVEAFR